MFRPNNIPKVVTQYIILQIQGEDILLSDKDKNLRLMLNHPLRFRRNISQHVKRFETPLFS